MLTAQNINLTYPGSPPVEALRNISFELANGSFTALLGPSGCGKSTLLRLVAGLLPPSAGVIRKDAATAEAAAFVFQSPTLLPWRTVLENVRLPLELGPAPRPRPLEELLALLELTKLRDFANAYPHQLSGGMQMRASLARALAVQPRLLLLDEPFGALDDLTRLRLNEELLALWQRDRWTALFVTHNVSEAVYLSERVLVLSPRPGRVVADVAIPFPYPRPAALRADPEFARLTGQIASLLLEGAS